MSEAAALRVDRVARRYVQGESTLEVFRDVSLSVKRGELVALIGQSGAGKSSLLHMAGLLEAPSEGEVWIDGLSASALPDSEVALRLPCLATAQPAPASTRRIICCRSSVRWKT